MYFNMFEKGKVILFMELRKGRSNDLTVSSIWKCVKWTFIVIFAFAAFIFAIYALCFNNETEKILAHNEQAERFNSCTIPERQLILQFFEPENIDLDTLTMGYEKEIPSPLTILTVDGIKILLGILLLSTLMASIITNLEYNSQRNKRTYFYADFPINHPTDYILIGIMLPFGWLFFLISWRRMQRFRRDDIAVERMAVQELAKRELSDDEVCKIYAPEIAPCSPQARHTYINRRTANLAKYRQQQLKQARQDVQDIENRLREYSEMIKNNQHNLNAARIRLTECERAGAESITKAQASAELDAICAMRGVSILTNPHSQARDTIITFVVKSRIPYRGCMYDVGDYQISITDTNFTCKRLRSGVRFDATSKSPSYETGSGFCFGSRLTEIKSYIQAGRIVEAVTLIVDCLHSVNSDYDRRNIPSCFRKVKTVERAAERLALQQNRR